jgi:hypothetical protein
VNPPSEVEAGSSMLISLDIIDFIDLERWVEGQSFRKTWTLDR